MERMIVLLNKGLCVLLCFLLLIPTFFGGGGWAYATEMEGTPEEFHYEVTYDGIVTEVVFGDKGVLHLSDLDADNSDLLIGTFEDLTSEDIAAETLPEAGTSEVKEEFLLDGLTKYKKVLSTGEVLVFSFVKGDTYFVEALAQSVETVSEAEISDGVVQEDDTKADISTEIEQSETIATNDNGTSVKRLFVVDETGQELSDLGLRYYRTADDGTHVEITQAEYDQLNQPTTALTSTLVTQTAPSVVYSTHIQNIGWQKNVSDDTMAGTTGLGLRLEAMKLALSGGSYTGSIVYSAHVQNEGWMSPQKDDAISGSLGKSQRMEAIQISLSGAIAEAYDVYYRVHIQDIGWTAYTSNGKLAGSAGMAKRLEAMEVKLVKKGDSSITTGKAFYSAQTTLPTTPVITYSSHVQNIGWQSEVKDGAISGTVGFSQRVEAVRMQLGQMAVEGNIQYRVNVQDAGWTEWSTNGQIAGTLGQAKRVEAIEAKLSGDIAAYYDVYYSVYSESYGWLAWAKNGEPAGTEGLAKRVEALKVVLVQKGKSAPSSGSTNIAFVKSEKPVLAYQALVQDYGWLPKVADGILSGTVGKAKQLEALRISLTGMNASSGISYRTNVEDRGWMPWTSNDTISGTIGEGKKAKAIQIQLSGTLAESYDIYYRVHAQNYGWLGWAKNGESAGVELSNTRLEAYEVKLIKKGQAAPTPMGNSYIEAGQLIYLDPGHGGWDSGASFSGIHEKTINLKVALKVKAILEAKGYNVAMTRTSDVSVSGTKNLSTELLARAAMANAANADIFVSIHHNSAGYASSIKGIETFYYGYYAGWEPEINQSMHLDPERLANSVTLANKIHSSLINSTNAYDRGIFDETFAVLRETAMPAVLLELGFMSNATELAKLATDSYQNILAQAVANGIIHYYR